MKKSLGIIALISACFVLVGVCNADDRAAKAQALVEKAVAIAQKDGLKRSLEVINEVKGPLVDGDLYVFAMSLGNMRLAAGSPFNKPKLGTRATADFNKKMAEIAKKKGSGWLEYSWPKPDGSKPVPKRTFIMRVPGEDAYFGCGYYKE